MSKSAALLLVLVFLSTSFIITAKPVSAADLGSWTTKTPIPHAEGNREAAAVNGKIYVMGGSINYEYDPSTDSWVEKMPMPTPRVIFGIAVCQNKIYAIGGSILWPQGNVIYNSGVNEVYDPSTDTWETREPLPTNRSEIEASVVCGKIHLIGPDSHDVYEVATNSWTTKEQMPHAVHRFGSAVVDNKIYVIGWNRTQIYNPDSDTWSLGASSLTSVFSAGVCATTGVMAPKRIYVIGGSYDGLQVLESGDTQVYDPKNDSWTLGAPMLTPCFGLKAVVVNDKIYAIGGTLGMYSSVNTNEQYTPVGYGTPDPSYENSTAEPVNNDDSRITGLESTVLVVFSVAVVALVSAGLIVYFKKRKH